MQRLRAVSSSRAVFASVLLGLSFVCGTAAHASPSVEPQAAQADALPAAHVADEDAEQDTQADIVDEDKTRYKQDSDSEDESDNASDEDDNSSDDDDDKASDDDDKSPEDDDDESPEDDDDKSPESSPETQDSDAPPLPAPEPGRVTHCQSAPAQTTWLGLLAGLWFFRRRSR